MKLNRHKIKLVLIMMLAVVGITNIFAQTNQPNILFILADDQSPYDLKIYNQASELTTPVIDSLASAGLVFDGAYHAGAWSGAVCTPSRTMIMTGRSTWHIPGNQPNSSIPALVPTDIANNTMAAIFNRAGYSTMRTCKSGNSYGAANDKFTVNKSSVKRGGTDETGSAWHAEQVLEYLNQRQSNKDTVPFLIYYGFSHPHDPRNGKEGLLEKYGAVNHTNPNALPALNSNQPKLAYNYLPEHPFFHGHKNLRDEVNVEGVWENRDEATIRNEMGREFACSENIDQQIGRVLDKLKEMGELENTYIFYTSDHGIAIGKHGLQGKQNLYEHTWRVPFIVNGPGVKQGRVMGNIYLYDVLGTMCDLAGIVPPTSIESESFRPVLEGEKETVRDVLFGTYSGGSKPGMRSVRKGDWKLIKYDVDNETGGKVRETQLFNLAENPNEFLIEHHAPEVRALSDINPTEEQVDLAENSEYADKLAEMEALLLEQMKENDDPYRFWDQPQIADLDSGIWVDFTGATAVASDTYQNQSQYSAEKAIDFDTSTKQTNLSSRWATNPPGNSSPPENGWTLEITFPQPVYFNHVLVYDFDNRVNNFAIEVLNGNNYVEVFKGNVEPTDLGNKVYKKNIELDEYVHTSKVIYHILECVDPSKGPSTWAINLYADEEKTVGIKNIVNPDYVVYPTFVEDKLKINATINAKTIYIYTIEGKKVFHQTDVNSHFIDMKSFKEGVYIVIVTARDGTVFQSKIVKVK